MLDVNKLTLYEINHAAMSDQPATKGPHAGEKYLVLFVGRKGDTSDNYTKVPTFGTTNFLKEFNQAQAEGREPDWTKALDGNVFDREKVKLNGAYKRVEIDAAGHKTYYKDASGNDVIYTEIEVTTLKSVVWELPCDPNTGLPIVLGIHEGKPVFMPECPKRRRNEQGLWETVYEYQRNWSPEERRDQTLAAFYEKVGEIATISTEETAAASGFPEEEAPAEEAAETTAPV